MRGTVDQHRCDVDLHRRDSCQLRANAGLHRSDADLLRCDAGQLRKKSDQFPPKAVDNAAEMAGIAAKQVCNARLQARIAAMQGSNTAKIARCAEIQCCIRDHMPSQEAGKGDVLESIGDLQGWTRNCARPDKWNPRALGQLKSTGRQAIFRNHRLCPGPQT
ncbi:MAG TPA: hypothetical protein VK753_04250 [Xanthomonadaceae bacterium]|nr:hypothetical protein [Xanthomonadaceae bacterium]